MVMEVIDIVLLIVIRRLGCTGEQVIQDQRVRRIYIDRVVLNCVTAQIGPVFCKGLGGEQQ